MTPGRTCSNVSICALALVLLGHGCTREKSIAIGTQGEGESCDRVSDCRAGLGCEDGACVPLEPLPARTIGAECETDTDCADGLFCSRQKRCSESALRKAGESCGLSIDCEEPLVCNGRTGQCTSDDGAAGTANLGESCTDLLDCRRPYVCGLDGSCTKPPLYLGPDCSRSDRERGAFRVYFELPDEDTKEFYRLPFPNDVRRVDGQIDLSGHAAPEQVLGVDIANTYFGAVEQDVDGFATNAPVFFRFSDIVEPQSICLTEGSIYPSLQDDDGNPVELCADDQPPNVRLINIDPDSPSYNTSVPVQLAMSQSSGQYICQNWLGIAPLAGQPLAEDTTYAALVTTGVRDIRGDPPLQDRHFAEILGGERNTPAMQPLLAWLNEQSIAPSSIAGATVFTTGAPSTIASDLREGVHRLSPEPSFNNDAVVCGSDTSPCNDGGTRGCLNTGQAYSEIQGTYPNPVWQSGTRPYERPEDGGALVFDANGLPVRQDTESMCYSLAVPTGTPPETGWPLVVYGHGTGGDYRSALQQDVAETLAQEGFAVFGFDNVSHGPRQGDGADAGFRDPGRLFFNLLNPRASRDNVLQGAADLFHLFRLLQNDAPTPSGTGPINFDPTQLYFLGHSQGTVIAAPFLTAEINVAGAALSGAGAELALSILNKTKPSDVGRLAGILFGDRNLSRVHPMLGIFALLFGEADALNFAPGWVANPPGGRSGTPLLHILGVGDSFTPDATQHALVRAAELPLVEPVPAAPEGVPTLSAPLAENLNGVTAGGVQLLPESGNDGHFVLFTRPEGDFLLETFYSSARSGAPQIERQPPD